MKKTGIKKIKENKDAYTFNKKFNKKIFDYFSVDIITRDYDGQNIVRISYKKDKFNSCLIDLPVIFDERLEYTKSLGIPNFKEDVYKVIMQTWIIGFISAFNNEHRKYFEKYLQWNQLPVFEYVDVRFKEQLIIKNKNG